MKLAYPKPKKKFDIKNKNVKKKSKKLTSKKIWRLMSIWIRLRDCLKTTGNIVQGVCYTCDKRFKFNDLQAGHLIDGHTGKNFLDERGIRIQCCACNVFRHGLKEVYIPKFIKENGQELYDEILREKEAHKWTQDELKELKDKLQENIKYINSL